MEMNAEPRPTTTTSHRGSDTERIYLGERCQMLVPWPDDRMVACQSWPEAVWFIDGQRVVTCHAHDAELRDTNGSQEAGR